MADVGYKQHFTQNQWASKDKLHLIRSMMRLRKKGALPPVYPNGWFALLDSDQVNVNQVKYVTALGKLQQYLMHYTMTFLEKLNSKRVYILYGR